MLGRFRHLPHPLEPHVFGAAGRYEWTQEIGAEDEPQEALLIEAWVNLVFDFPMFFGQFAPVDAWRHMVCRVEAVVGQGEV